MSLELRSFVAFRDSFSVGPVNALVVAGRPLVVHGPNGVGKTTLLLGVAGFLSTRGSLILNGRDVSGLPPGKRGIAYVPARPSIPAWKSVREVAEVLGSEGAIEGLRAVGLEWAWDSMIEKLSFGQAKAVQLILAVYSQVEAIAADEPFAGLSEELGKALWGPLLGSRKPIIVALQSLPSWAVPAEALRLPLA